MHQLAGLACLTLCGDWTSRLTADELTKQPGFLDLNHILYMKSVRPWNDAGPMLLGSIYERIVARDGTFRGGFHAWMEDDIAADFQQLSHYCKRMLQNQTDWYRSLDHMIKMKEMSYLPFLIRRYLIKAVKATSRWHQHCRETSALCRRPESLIGYLHRLYSRLPS